jgi:hypothetical protein
MVTTSEQPFDLVFFPAYPSCLVPMDFSEMNGTIRKSNLRDALAFAPSTLAIELSNPGNLTDSSPNRKRFNLRVIGPSNSKCTTAWFQSYGPSVNGKE